MVELVKELIERLRVSGVIGGEEEEFVFGEREGEKIEFVWGGECGNMMLIGLIEDLYWKRLKEKV